MKRLLMPALMLFPVVALAAEQRDPCPFTYNAIIGGRVHSARMSPEELAEAPLWDPASGEEPPLSLGAGIRAAIEEIRRVMKDADQWQFDGVQVFRSWPDTWVYLVHFATEDPGDTDNMTLGVLMNGKVTPLDRLEPVDQRRKPLTADE